MHRLARPARDLQEGAVIALFENEKLGAPLQLPGARFIATRQRHGDRGIDLRNVGVKRGLDGREGLGRNDLDVLDL